MMRSEVENKKKPEVSRRDKILSVIGGLAAIACVGAVIVSISDNLPYLLNYGSSRPGVWVGGMLQLPVIFAAMLLLSFSCGGFQSGLQGEAAAVHFRKLFSALIILLICFALNLVNLFAAHLMKRGLASEIAEAAMHIFVETLFVLVLTVVVAAVLFLICAGSRKAEKTAESAKEFSRALSLSGLVSVVLVLVTVSVFAFLEPVDRVRLDGAFAGFQASDLDGSPADQTVFADHDLTLVNVWATFMEESTAELPVLAELHEEYQDQGFQVVGICADIADEASGELLPDVYETALEIVREDHGDVYRNINPAGSSLAEWIYSDIPSFPTSIFVDREGNQVGDAVVGSLDKDEWKAEIEKRLEMTAAEAATAESTTAAAAKESTAGEAASDEMSFQGFVSLAEAVPDVILEIRYYSTYNFVGERIDGYNEPCALITKEAADALKGAAEDAKEQGYMLKIYDAYRPQTAVDHFIKWAEDTGDTRMKEYFYPELDKSVLFDQGYIAEKSGHSRGSTVDLTLFDMDTGKDVDMGGTFDYFGELSHPDYTGELTEEQIANRNVLRDIMLENGFRPLDTEWWHFTLENEPYPDTYFTFPVEEPLVSGQ